MKLLKRNGKEINIKLENGILIPEVGKLGQRDSVFFVCRKCNKEASRRISLFSKLENLEDRDFYCQQCNTKENNLEKYGVENTMQIKEFAEKCAKSFKENNDINKVISKRKDTLMVRYGDRNYTNQSKREETNLERYGVKNTIIKNRQKETNKRKYNSITKLDKVQGFTWLFKKEDYKGLQNNYKIKCNECGLEFYKNAEQALLNGINCPKCTPYGESSYERELRSILDELGVEYISNTREIIKPYEIDIYIPSIKLGIEINGLYWHSNKFKENNYHYKKYLLGKEAGIELWQFFEDEWVNQKSIIINKIKLKLGIYSKRIFARKCTIRKISKVEADSILLYHLIGPDASSIKLGLFYENELVSAMTFKKKQDGYILNRYITKENYIVIGAFSKLLKFFTRNYTYSFIESFSENRYSYGNVYKTNGFIKSYELNPDYWYIIGNKRYHKFGFRKKSIINKFNIKDKSLTEKEMMESLNINRIYNAGLTKWIM